MQMLIIEATMKLILWSATVWVLISFLRVTASFDFWHRDKNSILATSTRVESRTRTARPAEPQRLSVLNL